MADKNPRCCSGMKVYVFKSEMEKFMFCQSCVVESSNLFGIVRLFKQVDAEAITSLRQFNVGAFKVDNTHSIKLSEYRNGRLCKYILSSGNECLITAQNKNQIDPRCSRHNPVKKSPKSFVAKVSIIDYTAGNEVSICNEKREKKRKDKQCGYHLINNGSSMYCSTKPFFGWPQGPVKKFRFCEIHAKIGMVNLNRLIFNSETSLTVFQRLYKNMSKEFLADNGDQDCVFRSVLKPLNYRNSSVAMTVQQLRIKLGCLEGPYPYSKLLDLAKVIKFNLLLVMISKEEASISPYRSFIICPKEYYIILVWNNISEHTEPVHDESNTYFWSQKQLLFLQFNKLFDLNSTLTYDPNSMCLSGNVVHSMLSKNNCVKKKIKMDDTFGPGIVLLSSFESKKERESKNPGKNYRAGMFKYEFINDTGIIETDYVSEDDQSVEWMHYWDDIQLPSIKDLTSSEPYQKAQLIFQLVEQYNVTISHGLKKSIDAACIVDNHKIESTVKIKPLTATANLLSPTTEELDLNASVGLLDFQGFTWKQNSCSWDTIMTSLLYIYFFNFDKNDKELMLCQAPELHTLFSALKLKSKTLQSVKESWLLKLCSAKFRLGPFRSILVCIDHIASQYLTNIDAKPISQFPLFHTIYKTTLLCSLCQEKTIKTMQKTFIDVRADSQNPTEICKKKSLFFHLTEKNCKQNSTCYKCNTKTRMKTTCVDAYPLILFVQVIRPMGFANVINKDAYEKQTTRIPTELKDNGVIYSLCCVIYADTSHFVMRTMYKNKEYEYDGMKQGEFRQVFSSAGYLRPIIKCESLYRFNDTLIYKQVTEVDKLWMRIMNFVTFLTQSHFLMNCQSSDGAKLNSYYSVFSNKDLLKIIIYFI